MIQPDSSSGFFPTSTSSIPAENVASSSATTLDVSGSIASLRDAALKTIKSKRKKATTNEPAPVPTRPLLGRTAATPSSVLLDYGSEEQASASAIAVDVQPDNTEAAKDDNEAREEGEISDDEDPNPSVSTVMKKSETEIRGE